MEKVEGNFKENSRKDFKVMKILFLSDLHFASKKICNLFEIQKMKNIFKLNEVPVSKADVIVIAGDIFESSIMKTSINPFEVLEILFDKKPVVFCLGNHEFAFQSHPEVIKYWSKWKSDFVHCLDIDGHFEIADYNFVGNVFWYDFSLNNCRTLMKGEMIDGWLDTTIQNFDPIKENELCQNQILFNIKKDKKNILVTHTVPHESLNWFSENTPYSEYNAYSGNKDFLQKLKDANFNYALCGHTHKRMTNIVYGINCINLGNDYYFQTNKIESFLIDEK